MWTVSVDVQCGRSVWTFSVDVEWFGSKKLILPCVLSVRIEKAFKMHESERGEVDFDLCFISKSERHRARRRTN